jgi:hypothetical protein
MGKLAFNDGAYARAVEWFEESYILAGSENNETISQDHVAEILRYAIGSVLRLFVYRSCLKKLNFLILLKHFN